MLRNVVSQTTLLIICSGYYWSSVVTFFGFFEFSLLCFYIIVKKTNDMMTEEEIRNLVGCYIDVEGYNDLRSILGIMSQEYPEEFDRKEAIRIIREMLRKK